MKNKSPLKIPQHQFDLIGKDVVDNETDCSPPAENSSPISMPENLNCEEARLHTFNHWPHPHLSKQKLARTGFYFIGPYDNVKCYFCNVEINCWEQDDDEVAEHMRWSQNCQLLRRRDTNNVPVDAEELDRILPPLTYDVCGPRGVVDVRHGSYAETSFTIPPVIETPVTLKPPTHPEFAIEAKRLKSFEDWPKIMKQKPKDLSDAGFFYTLTGDRVKCFSCGGCLRDWDECDVPWEQHALWFNKCDYLKLMKGQNYIDSMFEKKKLRDESESRTSGDKESRPTEVQAKSLKINPPSSIESTTSSSGWDIESGSGYKDGQNEKEVCDSKVCKICFACEYNTAFFPCGHVVACAKCASSLTKCPVCNKLLTNIMRIYFS